MVVGGCAGQPSSTHTAQVVHINRLVRFIHNNHRFSRLQPRPTTARRWQLLMPLQPSCWTAPLSWHIMRAWQVGKLLSVTRTRFLMTFDVSHTYTLSDDF